MRVGLGYKMSSLEVLQLGIWSGTLRHCCAVGIAGWRYGAVGLWGHEAQTLFDASVRIALEAKLAALVLVVGVVSLRGKTR